MIRSLAIAAALTLSGAAHAGPDDFTYGPIFENYGRVADIPDLEEMPEDFALRVVFDIAEGAEPGEVNRRLDTIARFINMHVRNGVSMENIDVAVVVHGRAAWDLTTDEWYAAHNDGAANANAELVDLLHRYNVQFAVCGQTAAHYDITAEDLLPEAQMWLSAMTAHAAIQQDGYTLNPF